MTPEPDQPLKNLLQAAGVPLGPERASSKRHSRGEVFKAVSALVETRADAGTAKVLTSMRRGVMR
jgi:hypothetical protein